MFLLLGAMSLLFLVLFAASISAFPSSPFFHFRGIFMVINCREKNAPVKIAEELKMHQVNPPPNPLLRGKWISSAFLAQSIFYTFSDTFRKNEEDQAEN